jgi:hypothetical protein
VISMLIPAAAPTESPVVVRVPDGRAPSHALPADDLAMPYCWQGGLTTDLEEAPNERTDQHDGSATRGVLLGGSRPEPAGDCYWERGEWWLAGDAKPWQPEAVTVVSDRLAFTPRLTPVA